MAPTHPLTILATPPGADYELIDSGAGEKLERFGTFILSRPDPQALWQKNLPAAEWNKAHASFTGADGKKATWKFREKLPEQWIAKIGGYSFTVRPMAFKHVGVFPEHAANWKWINDTVSFALADSADKNPGKKIKVLNLFGYTGGATLAALAAGAEVVHVDGSKVSIRHARENAEASGLGDKPVRWILDDAQGFVEREARRGNVYDGIIMDPPIFGRGPKGEVWNIETHLVPFLESVKKILAPKPLFVLLNGYASGYSALAYEYALAGLLSGIVSGSQAEIERGELTIMESGTKNAGDGSPRLLPAGIFARWRREP